MITMILAACSTKIPQASEEFALCIGESNTTMYGTEWCSHCKNQKKLFGDNFDYVKYVDCDKNPDACIAAGVKGYPTWVINGNSYAGEQSLEKLAYLTGCEQ